MKKEIVITFFFMFLISVFAVESMYVGKVINSREVEGIDDSEAINKFNIEGLNSISFDISSSKTLTTRDVEKISLNSSVENVYEFSNLKVETSYKEIDTSFFNVDERPIKQGLKLTNLLDEDVDIDFDVKYEIKSDVVVWNGTEYAISNEPIYFEAFEVIEKMFPELNESYLTGYTLYFGNNYFDFKDVADLDYKVSVYSSGGKNYINLQLNLHIGALESLILDPEIGWVSHIISTSADGAFDVFAIDLDNDDDIDVLSASSWDDKIAWYENDGSSPPAWTTHVITTNADLARSVFAIDIDNDNDIDVLSASAYDNKIAWYENNGGSPPAWTARTITTSVIGAFDVFAIDIDNDNDVDVLSASRDDKIIWYENDGSSPPAWTPYVITSSADGAVSVFAIDIDHDNDIDVLSASSWDDKIAWYENDGGSPPVWTTHVITTNADYAGSVFAVDLDNDNDVDVLSASAFNDRIAWYENDGSSPPAWTTHLIAFADGAWSVFAVDLDNDNDADVLSASAYDNKIAWYENNGGSPPGWTTYIITTNAQFAENVFAIDLDNDGDVDVLSASNTDDKIAWYESNLSVALEQPKLKFLFVPLRWNRSQLAFDNLVEEQMASFVRDLPLNECYNDNVVRTKLDVDKYNYLDFTCSRHDQSIGYGIKDFLETKGVDYRAYDYIIGIGLFEWGNPCDGAGWSNSEDLAWVEAEPSHMTAHEIGHFFDLEDEYCSNPAGSNSFNCNDGHQWWWWGKIPIPPTDINYLDPNPPFNCDPSEGGNCCELGGVNDAFLPDCSGTDICCRGNYNSKGGIATMSFTNAHEIWPGTRTFDDYSLAHLNTFPELNCN